MKCPKCGHDNPDGFLITLLAITPIMATRNSGAYNADFTRSIFPIHSRAADNLRFERNWGKSDLKA